MPMTWNDQSDVKLLVAILHTTSAKLDYAAIAKYMGPECTKIAVQTRIARLKKQVHDASNSAAAGVGNQGSTPVTPEKRKKGAKASFKSKDGGVEKRPMKKAKNEEVKEDKEDMETEIEESG